MTIAIESRDTLPGDLVEDLLREAYAIVAARLPKRLRRDLGL